MYTHAHNQSNIQVETPTLQRHDQIHKKLSKETLGFNFPYLSQFILPTFVSWVMRGSTNDSAALSRQSSSTFSYCAKIWVIKPAKGHKKTRLKKENKLTFTYCNMIWYIGFKMASKWSVTPYFRAKWQHIWIQVIQYLTSTCPLIYATSKHEEWYKQL